MKKLKLKNLLKLSLLCLSVSLFFTSCDKEQVILEQEDILLEEPQQPSFIIKTIFRERIESNPRLKNKLDQLNEKILNQSSKNVASKRVYNKDYDFVIDTKSATYIKDGEYHSYTFPIKQSPDQNIRNVFFSLNEDGGYDSYLIEYGYTKKEMSLLDEKELSKRTKMTKIDIELSSLAAKFTSKWVCTYEYKLVDPDEGELVGADNMRDPVYTVVMSCGTQYGYDNDYYDEYDPLQETSYDPNDGTTTYTSGGSFVSSPTFSIYDDEDLAMFHMLRNELNLTDTEYDFLYGRYDIALDLFNFLSLKAFSLETKEGANNTIDQVIASSNEDIVKENFKEFLKIIIEIPLAKLERYLELNNLLENNPWALIQDCAQQNGLDISNYQQLYNHTLPSQCIDRLNTLGDDFENQPLNEGNAAVANVDYYGVEITTRPDINGDGIPDTNAEIFESYKSNFSSLASGGKEDFQFSCDIPFNSNDTADVSWTFYPYTNNPDLQLWLSSNPLTAIFIIDASADMLFGEAISDDGAIMISKFTNNYWIGSTITTSVSGTQPFSGNRQWGFITNQNGNLELYARAVDVARVSDLIRSNPFNGKECEDKTYYNIGEATWSNLQNEIKQFIIDKGGQAEVVPKVAVPCIDNDKLKEILESNETIDQIPCD